VLTVEQEAGARHPMLSPPVAQLRLPLSKILNREREFQLEKEQGQKKVHDLTKSGVYVSLFFPETAP